MELSARRDRLARYVKAYLNDVEVTSRCFWANEGEHGAVLLWQIDKDGKFFVLPGEHDPASELLEGKVRLEIKDDAPMEYKLLFGLRRLIG